MAGPAARRDRFATLDRAATYRGYRAPCPTAEFLDGVLDEELPRYAEALERLGR
jgi:hypothetical protein